MMKRIGKTGKNGKNGKAGKIGKFDKIKNVYFDVVWYLLVYIFIYGVFSSVMRYLWITEASITAFSMFFALNHIRKTEKRKYGLGFTEALSINPVKLSRQDVITLVLLGIGLNLTIGGIINILPSGISQSYSQSYSVITESGSVYETIAVMAVATPVLEEIFFRGVIQRKLCGRLGSGMGLIASACVFGFMHFNIIWSIYSALVGFILGASYLHYKSALPGALVHGFFNLISCAPLLLSRYEKIYKYTFGNKVYVIVSLLLGIWILTRVFEKTWVKGYIDKNMYFKRKSDEVVKNDKS